MKNSVEITPGACFAGVIMLLLLPLRWVSAAVFAAAVHEFWHYGAIRLCGGMVYGLKIGTDGVVMDTEPLNGWKELVCAAAGPAGSFFLLLGAKYWPAAALCALIQGGFNLIPLYPLDGGRVLRCGLANLFPHLSGKTLRMTEGVIFLITAFAVLYGICRLQAGVFGMVCVALLLSRFFPVKKSLQRTPTGGTIEIH